MKKLLLLVLLVPVFVSCSNSSEELQPPQAPWTYPEVGFAQIHTFAGRDEETDRARLMGWDEKYYYFDWTQSQMAIGRGSGRVRREVFDAANAGGLELEKGPIKTVGPQVRNWQIVE
ncbi:MAG: hypothetical protein Q7Q71_00395 [Verrucomicrobiota bacterium JB023]|nr:hypothetical protein [Verrucomicrobiota bacterium JB023]